MPGLQGPREVAAFRVLTHLAPCVSPHPRYWPRVQTPALLLFLLNFICPFKLKFILKESLLSLPDVEKQGRAQLPCLEHREAPGCYCRQRPAGSKVRSGGELPE